MKKVLEIIPQNCGLVFREHGSWSTDVNDLVNTPEEVALVVFTGGEDVWPELYGENKGWNTFCDPKRDLYESKVFELAQKHSIPCAGICRGAQFLCVKSGGKLVQDSTGHAGGTHQIITNTGRVLGCNSSHHQMQLPPKDAIVLAWSLKKLSKHYLNGDGDDLDIEREIEVVYYPNINSVGVQYHPEWTGNSYNGCPREGVEYAQEVVRDYLMGYKAEVLKAAK